MGSSVGQLGPCTVCLFLVPPLAACVVDPAYIANAMLCTMSDTTCMCILAAAMRYDSILVPPLLGSSLLLLSVRNVLAPSAPSASLLDSGLPRFLLPAQ